MGNSNTPSESVAERAGRAPERIFEGVSGQLTELRDAVDTQRQDAASVRFENALAQFEKNAAPFGAFLAALGEALTKVTEKTGEAFQKAKEIFCRNLGMETADLDEAIPHYEALREAESGDQDNDNIPNIFRGKKQNWNEYIRDASSEFGVPQWAILAILRKETGNFNSNAENPFTSAKGLCQAVDRTWKGFLKAPDNVHFREQASWLNPETGKYTDSRFNPEAAIYFTAWYIRNVVRDVNRKIDIKGKTEGYSESWKLPEPARLTPNDMKHVALAYHSGPEGYLRWRRYQETKTDTAKNRLFSWQKRETSIDKSGKRICKSYQDEVNGYQSNVVLYAGNYAHQMAQKN